MKNVKCSGLLTTDENSISALTTEIKKTFGGLPGCYSQTMVNFEIFLPDNMVSSKEVAEFLSRITPFVRSGSVEFERDTNDLTMFSFDHLTREWTQEVYMLNPLDGFDDSELITELKKRGYSVSKTEDLKNAA